MVINATLSNSNSSWSVVQVDFTDCQVFELKLFLCCWCCRRCCCCHTIIWEIIWDFPWEWIWLINPRDHILCCPFFAILCLMKCMHCRKYVRAIVVHMLVNIFLPPLLQSSYLSEGCTGVQSYYLPIFKPNIEFRT